MDDRIQAYSSKETNEILACIAVQLEEIIRGIGIILNSGVPISGGFVDVTGSTVDVSGYVDVSGSSVSISGSVSVDSY